MNGLIEWFAKNGVAANLLAIFIAIVGVMTIGTLRQEVFPEFSSDMIYVRVVYPGAAPEEVEEGISQKVEEAIHGLTDVKKVTSTSQENAGSVMVELNPGTDAARALDEIKTRIDAIDTFPEEAEKPLIEEIIMRKQVINVAVSGEATEKTLRHYASKVRDQLMALDGITQVELANVRDMEISIEISEDTLRRYGMTFDEVAMAIRKSSVDLPGGEQRLQRILPCFDRVPHPLRTLWLRAAPHRHPIRSNALGDSDRHQQLLHHGGEGRVVANGRLKCGGAITSAIDLADQHLQLLIP